MSYRLRHKISSGSWIERTYYEKINVVEGECEVERVQTRNALLRKNFIDVEMGSSPGAEKAELKKKAKEVDGESSDKSTKSEPKKAKKEKAKKS